MTLLPLLHTGLDTWVPHLPAPYLIAGVLATAGVVAAGTAVPAAMLTRRSAIGVAEGTG